MITIEAMYEDGVLKPSEPLPLREHEMVRITVVTVVPSEQGVSSPPSVPNPIGEPNLAERIAARVRALPAGTLDGLPDDLAAEHDHHLYGTPKR